MTCVLKSKYRRARPMYSPDTDARHGGSRGNGTYRVRTGNTHHTGRRWNKGERHPIDMSAGDAEHRASR